MDLMAIRGDEIRHVLKCVVCQRNSENRREETKGFMDQSKCKQLEPVALYAFVFNFPITSDDQLTNERRS